MNKTKQFNYSKGKGGEEKARDYLIKKGWELVEMNYSNDIGEVDLIMVDKDTLVFVEVKMKSDDRFGLPEEMIGKWKLGQVRRVAEIFLMLNKKITQKYQKYRIDAVCILGDKIRHYDNLY